MLSVPDGKEMGVEVLPLEMLMVFVLRLRTSNMLTFSAAPVDPELALPPQALRPKSKRATQACAHKQYLAF